MYTKAKVVVFYNNRSYCHAPFLYNNMEMEFGTTYKYLGIVLASNGSFKPAIMTLANQATKALFSLFRVTAKLSFPDPSLTCFLFDILVKPILEYGNEVWGCFPADELSIEKFANLSSGFLDQLPILLAMGI